MKKLLNIFLSVLLLSTMLAASCSDDRKYTANIAYIIDAAEDGSNVISDLKLIDSFSTRTELMSLDQNGDSITVKVKVNSKNLKITGTPGSKTKLDNYIFFDGKISDSRYNIVNFAYIRDISATNMFFVGERQENFPNAKTIFKIYLKDTKSSSLDLYVIEVFDLVLDYSDEYVSQLPVDPLPGSWSAKVFKPFNVEYRVVELK